MRATLAMILLCSCVPGVTDVTDIHTDSAPGDSAPPETSSCPEAPAAAGDEVAYADYPVYIDGTDRRFATIQDAIWGSADGDVVLVCPGTYHGSIDFKGRAITLRSVAGAAATVLNAGGAGSVVVLRSWEPPEAVLDGFTLTGGEGTEGHGGGVFVEWGSPTLRHLVVTGNHAQVAAGVYVRNGGATLENSVLAGNNAEQVGGGFGCSACTGAFRQVTFHLNTAPRGPVGEYFWGTADFVGNILVMPEGTSVPAINWLDPRDNDFAADYNLIWPAGEIVSAGEPAWPDGVGWVVADPLLVDPVGGDWSLGALSPAIDAGPPDETDADGSRADLGAFGGAGGDWGTR